MLKLKSKNLEQVVLCVLNDFRGPRRRRLLVDSNDVFAYEFENGNLVQYTIGEDAFVTWGAALTACLKINRSRIEELEKELEELKQSQEKLRWEYQTSQESEINIE